MALRLITYSNLLKQQGITHFSSTRKGGVSKGNYESLNLGTYTHDDKVAVVQNRALLANELGIENDMLISACQTHEANVCRINNDYFTLTTDEKEKSLQGFDSLITDLKGVCICVTTADCVPVLLYDKVNNAIAAIHSGWRSTLLNIVRETVLAMQYHFGTEPQNLLAAIGPCISKEAYEVGNELYSTFNEKGFDTKSLFTPKNIDKYFFDIRKAVSRQLTDLSVTDIEVSPYCTYTDSGLFFSARRQGVDSGRMLSGIMLK